MRPRRQNSHEDYSDYVIARGTFAPALEHDNHSNRERKIAPTARILRNMNSSRNTSVPTRPRPKGQLSPSPVIAPRRALYPHKALCYNPSSPTARRF